MVRVRARSLLLGIAIPFAAWAVLEVFVARDLGQLERGGPFTMAVRLRIATSNLLVRYASWPFLLLGVLGVPLAPLLARWVAVDDGRGTAMSLRRALRSWLVAVVVLGGMGAVGLLFLSWRPLVAVETMLICLTGLAWVCALVAAYQLQTLRSETGRSRWHPGWLFAILFVLTVVFLPVPAYALCWLLVWVAWREDVPSTELDRMSSSLEES